MKTWDYVQLLKILTIFSKGPPIQSEKCVSANAYLSVIDYLSHVITYLWLIWQSLCHQDSNCLQWEFSLQKDCNLAPLYMKCLFVYVQVQGFTQQTNTFLNFTGYICRDSFDNLGSRVGEVNPTYLTHICFYFQKISAFFLVIFIETLHKVGHTALILRS